MKGDKTVEELVKDGYRYTPKKEFLYQEDEGHIEAYLVKGKIATEYFSGERCDLPDNENVESLE